MVFLFLFLTVSLAVSIPQLGLFISLFGGLCLSMLGVAFPALIQICVLYPFNLGHFNYVVIRNVILIVIGICAFGIGTTTSIIDIVSYFQS